MTLDGEGRQVIKIMLVDDSRLVREVVRGMVERDGEIRVVAEAANGAEALERCLKIQPDVILMDIQMPVMNGIEAVRRIMEARPTPIIVLSATIHPGEVRSTFAALRAGALDAMPKPKGVVLTDTYTGMAEELVSRIKFYARVGKTKGWYSAGIKIESQTGFSVPARSSKIVAVGASTGGPRTLPIALGPLPRDFPCPILIVQHMGHGFMRGFAEWLDREIDLPVKMIEEAVRLEPGHIYLPPDGLHMEVVRQTAVLREGVPVNGCIPSVDVLFSSVAREYGERAIGVILTGMGKDGAEGSLAIKKAGGTVIVQDEDTSVIFGMPRAAMEIGAATKIEPLKSIASAIANSVTIPDMEEINEPRSGLAQEIHEILLVDDSSTMRAMLADILSDHGYKVRQAENGRMALDEVSRSRPDLILLDVMMPELDGYAVCRELREDKEYLPILMITAKGDPQDLVQGIEAGADDYISKPFEELELIARVKSLLRIRSLQKKLYRQNNELESKNRELERLAHALDRANKELTLLSVTDGLTKAYNHRHFQERLKSEFSRAERYHTVLSCLLIDIDHFKMVNDTYGHPAGDVVLVRLVEIIHESVRSEDLVARYGGEEFVVLLPETGGQRALNLAQRIRERVEREQFKISDKKKIRLTISVGVSHFEPGGTIKTPDGLVKAADISLYKAKSGGRNKAILADNPV